LRWAELVALTPEDFDFKKNEIAITKSLSEESGRFYLVTPKSGKPRVVPIPEFISKDLKALVLSTSKSSPIFTSPEGGYLRHGNFRKRIFLPAVEKAGLKKFTFHELRDTAISQAISTGANILVISAIAGHANTSITLNIYGHQINGTMSQFKQAIDLFTNQKPEAMGLLTLLSEMGEPYAQLFLGLTYEKEWSKASNLKLACYWIGKSAEAGISQARLFFANRALNKSSCFDVEPTLEQADVWVKLAAMSNDVTIRNESKAMEEAILKIRLGIR
jgi:hypothetical protein